MVESAVKASIDLLGKLLVEEGKYLLGAEQKVKELRDELLWMRSFLRKADAFKYKDEIVWMWVCQVQKYVFQAEDIIDKFVLNVVSHRQQNGWLNKAKRRSRFLGEMYDLHQTASSIDTLKDEISTLTSRLEKYGLMRSIGINTDHVEEARAPKIHQIHKNDYTNAKMLVGLEKYTKVIINDLTSTTPHRRFHAIYGIGGLGRTTFVAKLLHDDGIKQHFRGGQAHVFVSKNFRIRSLLERVLQDLNFVSSETLSFDELSDELRAILQKKKCLVVLDDVWTKRDWDRLEMLFTPCLEESSSKLLLSSREKEVAIYVDPKALQRPDLLNEVESWALFQETMGWDPKESSLGSRHQQVSTEIVQSRDVPNKINLSKKVFKVCKGVPLAIVVLGGMLRKRKTPAEWDFVLQTITSQTGHDPERSCKEILSLGYDDLPYQLKPCFLHLANFPEDYEIQTESLYLMWVAEGLVTRLNSDRIASTRSLETVANDYLNDLAEVGLVEISDRSLDGWIKSIRIHDLVREMCLKEASIDNQLTTIDLRSCPKHQHLTTSDLDNEKRLLRMAIYLPTTMTMKFDGWINDFVFCKGNKYLRSLLVIPDGYGLDEGGQYQQLMACICSKFLMLRVLILNGTQLSGKLTNQVKHLKYLRYLSLEGTMVSVLPSCIGKLRLLEILDLRVLHDLLIPNTLWKLFRLRHLLLPHNYVIKCFQKLRVDTLTCLERIENLQVKKLQTKDMLKIKKLGSLSIKDDVSEEEILHIIPSLESGRLISCTLCVEGKVISNHRGILSGIVGKCSLRMHGPISSAMETMHVESLPQHLQELCLAGCQLKEDPMRILGSHGQMKSLILHKACYVGKKMSFHSKSFPLLTNLEICELTNLEDWELESGSMPMLEHLRILFCSKLKQISNSLPSSMQSFDFNNSMDPRQNQYHGPVDPYDSTNWLEEALLKGEHDKVVILGKGGVGKATNAMSLYHNTKIKGHFDVVAITRVPSRRSPCMGVVAGGGLIPRRNLQQLLKDLNPKLSRDKDLSQMSCEDLTTEIQQVMNEKKCLIILLNLEIGFDHMEADLQKTFGRRRGSSKLVITSQSDIEPPDAAANCHLFTLEPLTWWGILKEKEYWKANAGIKWNMLRHYLGHPMSADMLLRFLQMKENLVEFSHMFEVEHKQLTDSNSAPLGLSQIFSLCYDDLEPHLRHCLIYLAIFPEEVEISTKKLFQMWMADGLFGSKAQGDVGLSLENLGCSYLNQLVQRGMVIIVKEKSNGRAKTCQLNIALRDLCLARAKQDNMLMLVDQFECATPKSNTKIKTQHLAVHLDQSSVGPTSLDKKLSSIEFTISPTSALFFSNISNPLQNEDEWGWFIHICKDLHLLRILDLGGMWLTKGRLPMEFGNLTQLRFLSLRGTWLTHLPTSIEDLVNLQTLDLRVLESIFIPNVLWKLDCLMHLYLPDSIAKGSPKIRLDGLDSLQTLVNVHTDKVCLSELIGLRFLRKISIRTVHLMEAVEELDGVLKSLNTSLVVCLNSEIINANQTILASFQNIHKLKIKGVISVDLAAQMFPMEVEELTLKHTKLEEDPLPALEGLHQLTSLFLEHDSFIGKTMTFSTNFHRRANLVLCSLGKLELHVPQFYWKMRPNSIELKGCWGVKEIYEPPHADKEHVRYGPHGCFELFPRTKTIRRRTSSLRVGRPLPNPLTNSSEEDAGHSNTSHAYRK